MALSPQRKLHSGLSGQIKLAIYGLLSLALTTQPDDPLPFIFDEVEKQAAEQEKKNREIAQLQPEQENQAIAIEKAAKSIQEEVTQNTLKSDLSSKDNGTQEVAQTTLSSDRLQKLERDIVKEKTFGE